MNEFNLKENPHKRFNALTGEWILVSPHRTSRPWQGKIENTPKKEGPEYDPNCYLCPGNKRAGNVQNPDYKETFVFTNDFSSLLPESKNFSLNENDLLIAEGEQGICRVVCFSPRHDLSLANMTEPEIGKVIEVWKKEFIELGENSFINYVQIFENKGEIMGCSNPHPHGQIWAQSSIPVEPTKETNQFKKYVEKHERCLLCDYLKLELDLNERVVAENNDFITFVPFWAVWPFETVIISKRHFKNLSEIRDTEIDSFSNILKITTSKYDKLFDVSFPYSAGIHQSPTDGRNHFEWHFHYHFYPPLLRSATIKKFMVGYEMLANPQRDITAELSAERLRNL